MDKKTLPNRSRAVILGPIPPAELSGLFQGLVNHDILNINFMSDITSGPNGKPLSQAELEEYDFILCSYLLVPLLADVLGRLAQTKAVRILAHGDLHECWISTVLPPRVQMVCLDPLHNTFRDVAHYHV